MFTYLLSSSLPLLTHVLEHHREPVVVPRCPQVLLSETLESIRVQYGVGLLKIQDKSKLSVGAKHFTTVHSLIPALFLLKKQADPLLKMSFQGEYIK